MYNLNNGIQQLTSQQLVKGKILEWINRSNLQPGDKIQSQNQLAKALNVGPMTVYNAFQEFVQEGILHRIKGKGTFIVKLPDRRKTLKLAFMLARPNLTNPDENPNDWYRVQLFMKFLLSNMDENTTLSTVICTPDESLDKVKDKLKEYDAVVFSGDNEFRKIIKTVIQENVIQTMIIGAACPYKNCLAIMSDSGKNIMTGIRYLINSGHRRIAYLGADISDYKINGYKEALTEYGIPYDEKIVVKGINHVADGKRGASLLMNRNENFDAVFVDSDLKAIEVVRQFRQLGIKVPNDISVMGYGESTIMGFDETLTVVHTPNCKMITEGIKMLKEWVHTDRELISKVINLDGEIVLGETCLRRSNT